MLQIPANAWRLAGAVLALLLCADIFADELDFQQARQAESAGQYQAAHDHYLAYLASKPFSVNKRVAQTRLAVLQRGLRHGQDDGLAAYLQALLMREQGHYEQSLQQLDRLLAVNRHSTFADDARYLQAYIELMDRFDYPAALQRLQHISRLPLPNRYLETSLYGQAIALEQLGRLAEARAAFETIRERHTLVSVDLLNLRVARGNFKSRFWFDRSSARIKAIDEHHHIQQRAAQLLGGDFGLAMGARYSYDQPVGSGRQYHYTWNLMDKHQLQATHLTHWYTRHTDWRWESSAPLQTAITAGLTPVISHWWFGDEISPAFVRDNRDRYLDNIANRLVPLLADLPDAIVLLEPEFNKQGIEHWPEWDNVASAAIRMIKRGAPQVKVGLTLGDWANFENDQSLSNIEQAVALSDFVGFMLMTSASNESADLNPVWSVRERVQRAATALNKRFDKPLYLGYMALSSADHWDQRQAEYLRQLTNQSAALAALGVFGMGYFSLFDNPRQVGWFGNAENHFGLLDADGRDKPAARAFRQAAQRLFRADKLPPIARSPLTVTHTRTDQHNVTLQFNEWVRWRLEFRGQRSAAVRQFRGAGNRVSLDWNGEADNGDFRNERVAATLRAIDKGGNSIELNTQFTHRCVPDCSRARQRLATSAEDTDNIATRNGATIAFSDDQMTLNFPARHSSVILPVTDWTLQHSDQLRFDIHADQLIEGLTIGLIDSRHFQTELPLERYLNRDVAGWQSVNIALSDLPDNARRFGKGGKNLQFGELQLDQHTRIVVQQRLQTGSIRLRNLSVERRTHTATKLLGAGHDLH